MRQFVVRFVPEQTIRFSPAQYIMVFKLLFLLSLVLGSVFLDAIGLVEYEHEISSLDKLEWGFAELSFFFIRAVYRSKYLKRRIMYSYGHPGSFNPAVITNKEEYDV